MNERSVHFNGIGGRGIAPAAALALAAGWTVSGDDLADGARVRTLRRRGATVTVGANTRPAEADLIVATSAMPGASGPRVIDRLAFVDALFTDLERKQIAVAGSLGKSTAASVIHRTLAPVDASAYIGAQVPALVCGAHLGTGDWAVIEACEYRDAYRGLHPEIAVVLNIVQNHEDHFGAGTDGFARSLTTWLTAPDPPTLLVTPVEAARLLAPHLAEAGSALRVESVGDDADWSTHVLTADERGSVFALEHHGTDAGTWKVPAAGRHLVTAAACAAIIALELGIKQDAAAGALAGFRLPARRMSVRHHDPALTIVDDNARQPQQARALIDALRQAYPGHHLVVCVCPWGTKNKRDLPAWALALAEADTVWTLPVGDAARPGGEDPDADERLVAELRLDAVPAYTLSPGDDPAQLLPVGRDPGRPLLIATAGYDANAAAFADVHTRAISVFAGDR